MAFNETRTISEEDIELSVVAATNHVISSKQSGQESDQEQAMIHLVDILARAPGAIDIFIERQKNHTK